MDALCPLAVDVATLTGKTQVSFVVSDALNAYAQPYAAKESSATAASGDWPRKTADAGRAYLSSFDGVPNVRVAIASKCVMKALAGSPGLTAEAVGGPVRARLVGTGFGSEAPIDVSFFKKT